MDLTVSPHVLAIGETLMDCVQPFGASEPTNEYSGGSPANVAMTLGRLGRPVALHTWIGQDLRGERIVEHFSASHVSITPDSFGADHTSTALATLDESGAATYTFDFDWNLTAPLPLTGMERIVHAGSISSTTEPGATAVLDALIRARRHAIITYDPNARPTLMGQPHMALAQVCRFLAVADVVKVSDEDIAWLTGNHDLEDVVREWLALGPQMIIVTRGKQGALAFTASGVRCSSVPGKVKVADTVGAGDSFMGGIIDAMWSLGLVGVMSRPVLRDVDSTKVDTILARASAISDITVSRSGANPPWLSELA
ncbi:carbohydrate kinase family protein [Schaalia sp. lx-100]|uniref:carbohydrate kinase family protein n=1 Tax=Schaalia sp. lx-100 TaxID=2899081 RepID=UPI001E407D42|nr:carbohydrate kinase [Schaalia sp. lx-100]MCD4558124.1 carbohydrate kinase [Schaalia sp. lx-100]